MGIRRLHKVPAPYNAVSVPDIDYAQTADVVYLAHLDYPLTKLTRSGHTSWAFTEVTFGPTISPPVGASATAVSPNMTGYVATAYTYVVTAISDGSPSQESRASAVISATNDLSLSGNYNEITLPARPAGVDRWIIYKGQGGAYGYIGGTDGSSFQDRNIQPILSDTPPVGDNPFDAVNRYPSTVAFHQQRLFAGRTREVPNGVWGSQSTEPENMDRARPAKADDALSFALVGKKVNAVNQLVSMDDLLVLSGDAIWAVTGAEGNVITASGGIDPKKQAGRGASRLEPLEIDTVVFFQPAKGSSVRTLGFSFEIDGYASNNVAIFSPHLFEDYRIVSWAFLEEPNACILAVRNDGTMLCFTWEQEQQVWGWTPWETNGFVEEVAAITENGFDRAYIRVRRTINGVVRRFYERLALPHGTDLATACHLDCSITQVYDPPRNVIDQLWHLEGETVSAHYDGYAVHGLVVTEGKISLPNGYAATLVTVGLRYEGEIETLPPILNSQNGSMHLNRQQIDSIVVRTIDTKGIEIGASGADLEQVEERDGTEVADLPDIAARDYPITPPGDWKDTSTIRVVQREPFPAHIVGIFYGMKVGSK